MRPSAADADMPPSPELPEPGSAEAAARAAAEEVLDRLPPRMREGITRLLARWPGRIMFRSAASCVGIEIFDRSMTIAAQFFTSVFPLLILIATWVGGADSSSLADAVDLPRRHARCWTQAVQGPDTATFGIVGVLIVLASRPACRGRSLARTRPSGACREPGAACGRRGGGWPWS